MMPCESSMPYCPIIPMFPRRSTAYSRTCAIVALGLILRSFVAPGLMLVDGADGYGGLALVLCPAQNPSLNFDRLAGGDSHHHHHDGAETPAGLTLDTSESPGMHAESLDVGCVLWAGSASGSALIVRGSSLVVIPPTENSIPLVNVFTGIFVANSFQPRAPPLIT